MRVTNVFQKRSRLSKRLKATEVDKLNSKSDKAKIKLLKNSSRVV